MDLRRFFHGSCGILCVVKPPSWKYEVANSNENVYEPAMDVLFPFFLLSSVFLSFLYLFLSFLRFPFFSFLLFFLLLFFHFLLPFLFAWYLAWEARMTRTALPCLACRYTLFQNGRKYIILLSPLLIGPCCLDSICRTQRSIWLKTGQQGQLTWRQKNNVFTPFWNKVYRQANWQIE